MVVYVGLEDVVEGGDVVVAELNKIQFRQVFSDVRELMVVRSSDVRPGRPVPGRKSGMG